MNQWVQNTMHFRTRKNVSKMSNEWRRRAIINCTFLFKWSKKVPNLSLLPLALILEDALPKLLNIATWGAREVSWKSFLNLENNDKVNDLVQTSKLFPTYMRLGWAYRSKCPWFAKERKEMLLGLEKYHINQMIHFWWVIKHLI